MARAKRENAEKVTISIDSDVLLLAKHKALDERLTLSDYIQELVRKDMSLQAKQKPMVITGEELGIPLFDKVEPVTKTKTKISNEPFQELPNVDAIILQMRLENISYEKIAEHLNSLGNKNPDGNAFNKNWIDRRHKKLIKLGDAEQ